MGSAASTLTIPDILDEETCKKLAGEKFDQALFDTSKDGAGNITKEQFTQIWNSKMSTSEGETKATKIEKTGPEPDLTPVDLEVQKKFHSMSRWNKPWAEEMAPFIAKHPGCQNSVDAVNGNLPLHIAAQNGHVDLVANLLKIGVSMDAPNGTGTTALHMAKAYDYFWCARLIVAAGADLEIKNQDGFAAKDGIEGDKGSMDFIPALTSAHNIEELTEALDGLLAQGEVDKSALVMGGMQKKRSDKTIWTPEIDAKFKAVCKKC